MAGMKKAATRARAKVDGYQAASSISASTISILSPIQRTTDTTCSRRHTPHIPSHSFSNMLPGRAFLVGTPGNLGCGRDGNLPCRAAQPLGMVSPIASAIFHARPQPFLARVKALKANEPDTLIIFVQFASNFSSRLEEVVANRA